MLRKKWIAMKNANKTNKRIRIAAVILATSGLLSLAVNEIVKPFLDNYPEVKLIIILISVLSAYHTFLTFSLQSMMREEIENTNNHIRIVGSKIGLLKEAIPYSALDEIEFRHGHANRNTRCEIWIIANTLQEAQNDDVMLQTIYDNITSNNINYYYILPDAEKNKLEIAGLKFKLSDIHRKKKKSISGTICYRFDNRLTSFITAEYFDIVLYVDCDNNGSPLFIGNSASCEGFQCFSRVSHDNDYLYQPIDMDRILSIRSFHLSNSEFQNLLIGGDV